MRIAVMAGTPMDTKLGVDFIKEKMDSLEQSLFLFLIIQSNKQLFNP